ncbi:hypothetical protein HHI36_022330 [Cryptolaemus montrouzieri]|uniref:Uncharacterized protein n=1 Tax=Cryptolaemus montrouzieri TaxID=559131 RepID=A0ABD2MZH6_9CUCU
MAKASDYFVCLLKKTSFIQSEDGGLFLRVDSACDSVALRMQSMINDAPASVAINPVFSSTVDQTLSLLKYIFCKDPLVRVESKVHLLSRLKPDVRLDVVFNPAKVLTQVLTEYYCTREEILHLMLH